MTNSTLREEFAGDMLGVPGRFFNVIGEPGRIVNQRFVSEKRPAGKGWDKGDTIRAEVRFDDSCGNGHESFAITGDVRNRTGRDVAFGCLHDDIAKAFPELAPLIQWHLTSTDGPMHYIANTVYHAGNRDHNGKLEGEPFRFETRIHFGANPIKHKLRSDFMRFLEDAAAHNGRGAFDFEVIPVPYDGKGDHAFAPKYTFGGFGKEWHGCPFDTETAALDFLKALQTCDPVFVKEPTSFGEGKARDFDAARSCAVWPDATDAQLSVDPDDLKAALESRHPALMADFEKAMRDAGLVWPQTVSA